MLRFSSLAKITPPSFTGLYPRERLYKLLDQALNKQAYILQYLRSQPDKKHYSVRSISLSIINNFEVVNPAGNTLLVFEYLQILSLCDASDACIKKSKQWGIFRNYSYLMLYFSREFFPYLWSA